MSSGNQNTDEERIISDEERIISKIVEIFSEIQSKVQCLSVEIEKYTRHHSGKPITEDHFKNLVVVKTIASYLQKHGSPVEKKLEQEKRQIFQMIADIYKRRSQDGSRMAASLLEEIEAARNQVIRNAADVYAYANLGGNKEVFKERFTEDDLKLFEKHINEPEEITDPSHKKEEITDSSHKKDPKEIFTEADRVLFEKQINKSEEITDPSHKEGERQNTFERARIGFGFLLGRLSQAKKHCEEIRREALLSKAISGAMCKPNENTGFRENPKCFCADGLFDEIPWNFAKALEQHRKKDIDIDKDKDSVPRKPNDKKIKNDFPHKASEGVAIELTIGDFVNLTIDGSVNNYVIDPWIEHDGKNVRPFDFYYWKLIEELLKKVAYGRGKHPSVRVESIETKYPGQFKGGNAIIFSNLCNLIPDSSESSEEWTAVWDLPLNEYNSELKNLWLLPKSTATGALYVRYNRDRDGCEAALVLKNFMKLETTS